MGVEGLNQAEKNTQWKSFSKILKGLILALKKNF